MRHDRITMNGLITASDGGSIAPSSGALTVNNANFFTVTGGATVSSISGGANGQFVFLNFASSLPIVHSANLILPSELNYITKAGETILFKCNAANTWTFVSSEFPQRKGQNYIILYLDGSPNANGTEFLAAYNRAKAFNPNGSVKSATNTYTIVLPSGHINFTTNVTLDEDFVNIVSTAPLSTKITANSETITISASDIILEGIDFVNTDVRINNSGGFITAKNCKSTGPLFLGLSDISGDFENCEGGDSSFSSSSITGGTYTNCIGGNNSFGGVGSPPLGLLNGTFINCVAGNNSFGSVGALQGTYINCKSGGTSFGGGINNSGTSNGIFRNCISGNDSFGSISSGTYENCSAGNNSFGAVADGTFINCVAGDNSFGSDIAQTSSNALGYFNNCKAGINSFGSSQCTGQFYYCEGATDSFFGVTENTGQFYYCKGGQRSFTNIQGVAQYCSINSNSGLTISGGGKIRLSLRDNTEINAG